MRLHYILMGIWGTDLGTTIGLRAWDLFIFLISIFPGILIDSLLIRRIWRKRHG